MELRCRSHLAALSHKPSLMYLVLYVQLHTGMTWSHCCSNSNRYCHTTAEMLQSLWSNTVKPLNLLVRVADCISVWITHTLCKLPSAQHVNGQTLTHKNSRVEQLSSDIAKEKESQRVQIYFCCVFWQMHTQNGQPSSQLSGWPAMVK